MLAKEISFEENLRLPITDRIKEMRDVIVESKAILDSKRAILVTESYKKTENEASFYRRAKAFKKVLEEMDIVIWKDELIVGNHGTNGRRSAPVFPEWGIHWLERELDEELENRPQDPFIVPQHVKDELKEIFEYWRGKTVYDRYRELLPQETKKARDHFVFTRDLFERGGYGHATYDNVKIIEIGFNGLKKEIYSKMKELDSTNVDDQQKRMFYESCLITSDAVITFSNRFASEALRQAAEEKNSNRRKELEKIAEVCSWVPENPARNYWEALQVCWFLQLIVQIEANGNSVSPGRLDQYLWPYLKKDLEKGDITIEEAQVLTDCFWIKLNEMIKVWDTEAARVHPGFPMTQTVTVGGQTPEGLDAVNPLSYIMLNSQDHINLSNPQFTARIHKKTPYEFLIRIAEVIRGGSGMPAVFGDDTVIASMVRRFNVPIERARDYRIIGCIETTPKGFQGRVNGGYINASRVVDLALNNGIDRLSGKQVGPVTGEPSSFKSFEEVYQAYEKQMDYFLNQQVINNLIVDIVQREYTPHIFLSSITEGCIEKGKDLTWGGSLYGGTPTQLVGMATAADSLTAVKKVVFDDKVITMEQLKNAQDSNYEGEEGQTIRKLVLKAPKYGNDDDYADLITRRTVNTYIDTIEKHKDIDGRGYFGAIITLGSTVPHGWVTGATADGRLAGTPTSDSMGPTNGSDKNGPTAVLNSAAKIDQIKLPHGNVLNMKLNKAVVDGEGGINKFADLIKTYLVDMQGEEIQVNVLDNKDLLDAQKNPDNYKDLIVRVAGYSARFIELDREMQNDIIGRTENDNI